MTKGKATGRYFEGIDESRHFPGEQFAKTKIETRKQKFDQINRFITARGGWVVSVPGESEVRFEVLPGSKLVRELERQFPQYDVFPDGAGERILPHSVVEFFTKNVDGTLSLLSAGSTQPVASRVTHAGIARVEKFFFDMEQKTAR